MNRSGEAPPVPPSILDMRRQHTKALMDRLDRSILKALQDNFPLSERPYDILADELQITAEELWRRVQRMCRQGVIRRIGTSLDSRRFGLSSTLAAVSVPEDQVELAAEVISQFPEVTHSYLRKDTFNIWFTVIADDDDRLSDILRQVRCRLSLSDAQILNLPAKRLFKLDARFS